MKITLNHRKRTLAGLCLGLMLTAGGNIGSARAQAIRYVRLGPEFTAGVSMSTGEVPDGIKANPIFAWSAGALGELPVSPDINLSLGLVYDSRGFAAKPANASSDVSQSWRENYFSVRPAVSLSSFTAGLGFGIPFGTSIAASADASSVTIESNNMNTMIEVRLGGSFELTRSETGELRFLVEAAYPLTKSFTSTYTKGDDNVVFNGPIPTLQLGLTYLFNATELR